VKVSAALCCPGYRLRQPVLSCEFSVDGPVAGKFKPEFRKGVEWYGSVHSVLRKEARRRRVRW